ncbi:MAG: mechanosensitive ion channel domain-containing protein [Candidatus Krumholzibacteria bacterium]
MESVLEQIIPYVATYGLKVIGAVLILILGRFAAGFARRIVRRLLSRAQVDNSIISFACSLSYAMVLTFAVLASLAKFGVETTSFVAVMGAAGFAIGFALQGSLANFAAGILVLVLKPYRVGDTVEGAGVKGSVKKITLFNTVLHTGDNVRILVPNGKMYGDVIKNYSSNPTRRIDLVIGIGYDSSIKKARDILDKIISGEERILSDPAPSIAVAELADSSVNFVVRPWVKREDHWAVRCELLETIKEKFDKAGIEIPFPQQTVHIVRSDAAE